ncbi:hypothetical protein, partial [Halobacillus sp. BBL2006]|uniref:hypothetical protein n=1 Tax=Halobacillus sp. BBL2006 TaxID=1543706 RepID=UPI000542E07B
AGLLLLFLTGCINNASSVLVSENVLPKHFNEIAFSPEEGYAPFLVMKATDQATFNKLWDFYNFDGEAKRLDFDRKGVIFIGIYESSCESVVSNIRSVKDEIRIDIDSEMGSGGCAEIANPRSFIIEWDKNDLKKLSKVTFTEGHDEIKIPFKELAEFKNDGAAS